MQLRIIRYVISRTQKLSKTMGKGDKKTRRGKIANKSYGAKRTGKIKRKPTVEERIRVDKKM